MLNLLNIETPIKVNGKEYANSQAAYEQLKNFEGELTIVVNVRADNQAVAKTEVPKPNEGNKEVEYRIQVKKWMTEPSSPSFDFMSKWNNNTPMPLVIMRGKIIDETPGMYKMKLSATAEPSSHCFKCGRAIKHPVSVLYGLGPECGGHFHINPLSNKAELDEAIDEIRGKLENIAWEGWVIKSSIKSMAPIK